MGSNHRVVILGAGYTGMFTAVRLAHRTRRADVTITLVNPSDRFVERLRMHQIAAGQELADLRIPDMLAGTGVTFVRGAATALDPDARRVTVDGTEVLEYDTLVYALGSATDADKVPGADVHAFTLNSPEIAARFAERLTEVAAAGGTVTVCGGGLTGIEAATEIAESHPGLAVTLLSLDEPGAMMGDKARLPAPRPAPPGHHGPHRCPRHQGAARRRPTRRRHPGPLGRLHVDHRRQGLPARRRRRHRHRRPRPDPGRRHPAVGLPPGRPRRRRRRRHPPGLGHAPRHLPERPAHRPAHRRHHRPPHPRQARQAIPLRLLPPARSASAAATPSSSSPRPTRPLSACASPAEPRSSTRSSSAAALSSPSAGAGA